MLSNYPTGFNNGVLLRERPYIESAPGKVFWVGNNASQLKGEIGASDSNNGTFLRPFATLDYAIGLCAANRGDIIYVRPGYSATITAADAVAIDVAGVKIIGLGQGSKMPVIEFNHADATVSVNADDVFIQNIRFKAFVTSVTVGLNIKSGVYHTHVKGCVFDVDTLNTDEFLHAIRFVGTNEGAVVEDCLIDQALGGATAGIHLDADTAKLSILNNHIRGDYSTACIAGDTTLSTDILIQGNILENGIGGNINTEPGIELLTGTYGIIADNYIVCNVAAAVNSIVADTCFMFQNKYNETAGSTGINLEVADV